MQEYLAKRLLAKVMIWDDAQVEQELPKLILLAQHKYDTYQRFGPGLRFIESLATWLGQFDPPDRVIAYSFVISRIVYVSTAEMHHLVQSVVPDLIIPEIMKMVSEERGIAGHEVGKLQRHPRFSELLKKSLYLGLSDGAMTAELRRFSPHEISNEQIWQAYELSEEKGISLKKQLKTRLGTAGAESETAGFNLIWLLDDFSGSGNTYIRPEDHSKFAGKITKVFDGLSRIKDALDRDHFEVYLVLYVATRQSLDHISYWSEQFAAERGLKPIKICVMHLLPDSVVLKEPNDVDILSLSSKDQYYDMRAHEGGHIEVGGTSDAKLGFANCRLPVVLSHNTPNNSIYLLWGEEDFQPRGLFPRISRHKAS